MTGGVTEGYLQQNSLLSQNTADFTKEMDMGSERERIENQNQSNFPNLNIDDIATSQLWPEKDQQNYLEKQGTLGVPLEKHDSPDFKNKHNLSESQSQDEVTQLRSALDLTLQIIAKLGQELGRAQPISNDNQFLNQLEDIDSVPSLLDLLKFVKSDSQNEMIKHRRIQAMIYDSRSLLNA